MSYPAACRLRSCTRQHWLRMHPYSTMTVTSTASSSSGRCQSSRRSWHGSQDTSRAFLTRQRSGKGNRTSFTSAGMPFLAQALLGRCSTDPSLLANVTCMTWSTASSGWSGRGFVLWPNRVRTRMLASISDQVCITPIENATPDRWRSLTERIDEQLLLPQGSPEVHRGFTQHPSIT